VVEVTTEDEIKQLESFNPMTTRLKGRVNGGRVQTIKLEPLFVGRIALTCDRPDLDGDGVAELAADGTSVTRITATLLGRDGTPVRRRDARVRFHASRGMLSAREAQAETGTAEVELRAVAETVRARILAQAEGFEPGSLVLEFIPPEEHRKLAAADKKGTRK